MTASNNFDSEMISSATAPEIQLDLNNQVSDLTMLKNLNYLQIKPQQHLNYIVDSIIADPLDSSSHQKLEQYLYHRYIATIEELKLKQSQFHQQQEQAQQSKLQLSQQQCSNCRQLMKTIEQLQESAAQPCLSCIQFKEQMNKMILAVSNIQQDQIATKAVLNDLQHIFINDFTKPSNYIGVTFQQTHHKSQIVVDNGAFDQQIQTFKETLKVIKETSSQYLNAKQQVSEQQPNLDISDQAMDICDQTINEVVQAFNRATSLLKEKDGKNAQLTAQLNSIQIIPPQAINQQLQQPIISQQQQPSQMQLSNQQYSLQPNQQQQQYQNQHQPIQQQQQLLPTTQMSALQKDIQLFYELISQELFQQQTPSDENEFLKQKYTKTVTVRKSIADLLREVLQQLSQTFGRNDLLIEQNLQPPVLYIREQLDQHQLNILEEVQRVGSLALTVRYCIQSCIEVTDEVKPKESNADLQKQLQQQQQLIKSFSQTLRSLFSMSLWQEQSYLKKAFGTLNSQELVKLATQQDNSLPQGFFDEQLLKDLNDLFLQIPTVEVTDQYEKLSTLLQELQYKARLVPNVCADLSKIALELEEQNKQLSQKMNEANQQVTDLKEIVKQENQHKQELTKQLYEKDIQMQKINAQITENKNEIDQLKIENNRIPGLQKQLEENIKQLEVNKLQLAQLTQECDNHKQVTSNNEQQIDKQNQQIKNQDQLLSQQQEKLNQFQIQQTELVQARQEVINKNRELVQLCKSMEQRIGEQEQEIIKCKQIIGQEMPILQDTVKQLKIINQNQINQLQDVQDERRQLLSKNQDLVLINEKLQNANNQIKHENNEFMENYNKTRKEHNDITLEVEQLSRLYVDEQSKNKILGDNIDRVSDRNIELEKLYSVHISQLEQSKMQENQNEQLLMEANMQLQLLQRQLKEQTDKCENLIQQIYQFNSEIVKHQSENVILRQQLEQTTQQYKDYQIQTQNELQMKQKLINDITGQMSQLTYTANSNEGKLGGLMKTQFTNEMQKYLDMQQEQFNAQIQRLESDNTLLISELTSAKGELKLKLKENKQLVKENDIYQQQMKQVTDIQEKLAEKSKKLLKLCNQLKFKCWYFMKAIERIAGCSQGEVNYQLLLQTQIADSAANMTLTTLQQTQQEDLHSSDVLKIPNINEQQIKQLCDMIGSSKATGTLKETIKQQETELKQIQQQHQILTQQHNDKENQLKSLLQKYEDSNGKTQKLEETVKMLSQNLNLSREMLKQQNVDNDLTKIHEKVHRNNRNDQDDTEYDNISNLSFNDGKPKKIVSNPQILKSSNLLDQQKRQQHHDNNQQYPQYAEQSSRMPQRYPQSFTQDQSMNRAVDYIPLTTEEQMNIQKLLKQNQVAVTGQCGVLPSGVFVDRK